MRPAGLSYSVDVPQRWNLVGAQPALATFRNRANGCELYLSEQRLPEGAKAETRLDGFEAEIISRLNEQPAAGKAKRPRPAWKVALREKQSSAWLPGRLTSLAPGDAKDRRAAYVWIAAHDRMLYGLTAVGPRTAELDMRETLDAAAATLRPAKR